VTVAQIMLILIENLPALIKMLHAMAEKADQDARNQKVKSDIETITKAFRDGDAEALNRLFKS
jgi:hypothetical protein